jgi:hypothetical protein
MPLQLSMVKPWSMWMLSWGCIEFSCHTLLLGRPYVYMLILGAESAFFSTRQAPVCVLLAHLQNAFTMLPSFPPHLSHQNWRSCLAKEHPLPLQPLATIQPHLFQRLPQKRPRLAPGRILQPSPFPLQQQHRHPAQQLLLLPHKQIKFHRMQGSVGLFHRQTSSAFCKGTQCRTAAVAKVAAPSSTAQ